MCRLNLTDLSYALLKDRLPWNLTGSKSKVYFTVFHLLLRFKVLYSIIFQHEYK